VSLRDLVKRAQRALVERKKATKSRPVIFFLPSNGRDVEDEAHEIHGFNGARVTLYEIGGPDDPNRLSTPEETR
jgi:hypothetical protein